MAEGSFFVSMWSALGAFIGTLALVFIGITIARWRGIQIWSEPPPSPDSVVTTTLSAEDKEKIDKLRSSVILRHLNRFTMTLNDDSMATLTSTTQEESTTSCIITKTEVIKKEEEQPFHICVPLPGQQSHDSLVSTNDTDNTSETATSLNGIPETRNVPNLCVICHEEYEVSDKVCWASSSDCTHVFHEECIVRWLTSLGWMKLKEQKVEPENISSCLNYDLECPMCRGEFICKELLTKNTPPVVVDVAAAGEESV